jgi:DNA polymerase III alpha subunit
MEDFNNRVPKKTINRTALKSLFCAGALNNLINNENDTNTLADRMNVSIDDFQSIILDQYNLCGRVQQDVSVQFDDGGSIKDLQYTDNVIVYAYLVKIKEIYTKQSKKMAFTKFEDYNGRFEVTWFPESWNKVSNLLRKGNLYKIILTYNNGIIGLFASDIKIETK